MKNVKCWLFVTLLSCMLVNVGCGFIQKTPDGATIVTPEGIQTFDAAAAVAEPAGLLAISLSALWPPAAIVGGLLAGVAGTWKKMRPEVVAAKTQEELATTAGQAMVLAIDELKSISPESWAKLKPLMEDFIQKGGLAENFIRELRGLNPKV